MSRIIGSILPSLTKTILIGLFCCLNLISCGGSEGPTTPDPTPVPTPPPSPAPTPLPTPTLGCVSHDFSINQWGNRLKAVNFTSNIGAEIESVQISCVKYFGIPPETTYTIELQAGRSTVEYKINNGQWQSHDTQNTFGNNDAIYLRTTVGTTKGSTESIYVIIDGNATSEWQYQVENTERTPITWQVGPSRDNLQLSDISNQLVAGDIVELDGNATYNGVEFTQSGLEGAPITIRGITINGQQPIISGNISSSKEWTISFNQSHFYILDNVEITGGTEICLRNMAHQITITNTYIHDCNNHGILGTDEYSGTLTLNHIEVANVGNAVSGAAIKHAVYVATDAHRFPDSKLHIEHSYIHDFRGNGIKSRARRTEVLFNWVQQSSWINPNDDDDHSYYSLELIGPDGYEPEEPMEQRVIGNVFEHIKQSNGSTFGMRFGGDGTGYSYGKVWLTDNIIISPYDSAQSAVFSTQYKMNSIYMKNNIFMRADTPSPQWAPVGLFRNSVELWYTSSILIHGENNWYPAGSDLETNSNTFPSSTISQWQLDNPSPIEDITGVAFNSTTGEIQFPSNSKLLDGSFTTNPNLDSVYQVNGYNEYNNQSYQGYLQRPAVGEIP